MEFRNPIFAQNRQSHKYKYLKDLGYYEAYPKFHYLFENQRISTKYLDPKPVHRRRNSGIENIKKRKASTYS